MFLYGAFLSRPVLVVLPYILSLFTHTQKPQIFVMSALCCLPPFCISQETLPRVPSGYVFTTTKKYGSSGHIIYDICGEVDLRMSSDTTGETRNVFCKAGSSNFWTQRAFCSSANKYLSAAFSDTPKNRFTLVREVRICLESCNRPPDSHVVLIFTL